MNTSRTSRFLSGVGTGYVQLTAVMITGVWLTPFFLHRLGQHDYGLWLMLTQVLGYLALLDVGVMALLPRETAAAVGRHGVNSLEVTEAISDATRIAFFQIPFVFVVVSAVWLFGRVFWESADSALAIILSGFLLTFPLRILPAVLQGLQEYSFLGKAQLACWSVATLASVLLVRRGSGIIALAITWPLNQLLIALLCWYRIRSQFPEVLPTRLSIQNRRGTANYMRRGGWVSVSQIAQVFMNATDLLVVGKLLGPAAAVPYSCTNKLASVLANKPQMLMQVAFPALSEIKGSGDRSGIGRATSALRLAVLASSGAVACGVLAANKSFVEWWIGPSMFGGLVLTAAVAFAMIVRHWSTTFTYAVLCFGYERRLALTAIADGILTVCGSLALVPIIGPIGAPVAAIAASSLISIPSNLAVLSRELDVPTADALDSARQWVSWFLPAAMCSAILSRLYSAPTFVRSALLASLAVCFYTGLIMPLLLRHPLGPYLRPKLHTLAVPIRRLIPGFAK